MARREKLVLTIGADGRVARKEFKDLDEVIKRIGKQTDEVGKQMKNMREAAKQSAKEAEKAGKKQAEASEMAAAATKKQVEAQKAVESAVKAAAQVREATDKKIAAAAEAAAKKQIAEIKRVEEAEKRLADVKAATNGSRKKADADARKAAKEELKAAQAALKAKQDAAKAAMDAVKKEAADRKKMADDAVRAAREEAKIRTQAAKEAARVQAAAAADLQRRLTEAARTMTQARNFAGRIEDQNDPIKALRRLQVLREEDVKKRIAEIERVRKAALKADNLSANDRKRINAATDAQIARERARLEVESISKTTAALNAMGMRKKAQIQEEIAAIKERERVALSSAGISAGQRVAIERRTAEQIRALNRELAQSTASAFQERMRHAAQSIRGLAEGARNAGVGVSMGVSAPAAFGVRAAIKAAMGFEQAIQDTKAISPRTTKEEMKELDAQARKFGESTSFTNIEVAQAQKMLMSNGLTARQILDGALEASLAAAVALDIDLSGAANIATDAMLQFGKSAEELMVVADLLTGARASSKYTADDLRLALGMGGGVSGLSGMSLDEFLTGISIAAPYSTSGSDGGTGFKTMMLRLSSNDSKKAREAVGFNAFSVSRKVEEAQKNYAAATASAAAEVAAAEERLEQLRRWARGRSLTDRGRAEIAAAQNRVAEAKDRRNAVMVAGEAAIAQARKDTLNEDGMLLSLGQIADEIRRVVQGRTEQQANAILGGIFGQDAIRTAMALGAMGSEGVAAMSANVKAGNAKLAEETRLDSTQGSMIKFQSALTSLVQSIAESGLLDALRDVLDKLTQLMLVFNTAPDWVKTGVAWFMVFLAVLGPLMLVVGQLTMSFLALNAVFSLIGGGGGGSQLLKIFLRLGGAVASLAAGLFSIPALITAIFALVAGAVGLAVWEKWGEDIKGFFANIFDGGLLTNIDNEFAKFWENLRLDAENFGRYWKNLWGDVWEDSWGQKFVRYVRGEPASPQGYATGGIVRGAGTGTSDSIRAMLSDGEGVLTARAVRFFGEDRILAMNNLDPRAMVVPPPAVVAGGGGGGGRDLHPINLTINSGAAVDGLYGTPNAIRQLEEYQNRKAVLQPVRVSRAQG